MKVKICGIKNSDEIALMNKYNPDYIGFVFAAGKRQITPDTAKELKSILNGKIMTVGVFVNQPMAFIEALCSANTIDMIQLHGDEKEDFIRELKKTCDQKIIKALRVSSAVNYQGTADYLLLDAHSKSGYGGTGETFNWDLIHQSGIEKPFFLAGGMGADNVKKAAHYMPYAIDISSRLEANGIKNEALIKEFMAKYQQIKRGEINE